MKTNVTLSIVLGLALAACGGAGAGAGGGAGGGGGSMGGGGGGGDTGGGGDVGSLTLRNNSSYMIYQMHLSPYDDPSWGPDLLGGDPLLPGEGGRAPVFQCAKYDLKLVDDEGGECVVNDIDLCFNDEDWSIDDDDLAICQDGWGH
jgi:hypothetical protein